MYFLLSPQISFYILRLSFIYDEISKYVFPGLAQTQKYVFESMSNSKIESGAHEAFLKWVGNIKDYSTISKKWVSKHPFSFEVKRSSWQVHSHYAVPHSPTVHPTPTPLGYSSLSPVQYA